MHFAFVSLYDTGAAGLRSLSAFLKSRGHRVSTLFYGEMGRTHKEFHQFSKIEYAQSAVKWCQGEHKQELINTLQQLNPDLIGISLRSAFVRTAEELTKTFKERLSVPILWGGIHPTLCPDESIQYADIVCRGEGEFPLLDIAQALDQGRSMEAIPNLWVKRGENIFKNDLRALNDLDEFPFADFTEEDKYYIHAQPYNLQIYSIMTSHGCPFSCAFCCNSILRETYKGKGEYIRRRSIQNVISELLFAKAAYSIGEVIFQDDVFVDDAEWLFPFLIEYQEKIRLPFACYLHSQFVKEPIINALKEAGLYTAGLGIQAGSDRVRREVYHRRQSNEEIIRSARLLNNEIAMAYDIISDNPFETKEDLIDTIRLLLQFPHPFRLHLLTLTFFPRYPITRSAIEKGLIQGPNADVSADEWLMIYKEERPKEIQSLYLLIAATQHASVSKDFIEKALEDEKLLQRPARLFSILDRMIREEDYVHDYRKREKSLEYLERVERVLVIPSGKTQSLTTVLTTISEKYPDCLLTLLTGRFPAKYSAIQPPETIFEFTKQERSALQVLNYQPDHSHPKPFGIDWKLIRTLRRGRFDLAVLIHENRDGWGYSHVELLALMGGAKHILVFKTDHVFIELHPAGFLKKAILRKVRGPQQEEKAGLAP